MNRAYLGTAQTSDMSNIEKPKSVANNRKIALLGQTTDIL